MSAQGLATIVGRDERYQVCGRAYGFHAGELIGNSAEFEAVMAGISRDNGVRAYYFDMFKMARENLEESLNIRSNDP